MMHVGLIHLALQLVAVMWKTLTNVAPFNVCLTSLKGPQFGRVFPSIEGLLGIVKEDVEPLLSRFARFFWPLPLISRVVTATDKQTCSSVTSDKVLVRQIRVNTMLTSNKVKPELLYPRWLPRCYHVG
jgi:hypothetical protein